MNQVHSLDHRDGVVQSTIQDAAQIPALSHVEAASMASAELKRFITLVKGLSVEDWSKPTACPLWNVRQMVAHVTGAAAGYAHWAELKRQYSPWAQRPYRRAGLSLLDAINQIQVDDRAHVSPADLITELHTVGPRAIATRRRLPAILRALRLPMPLLGIARIDYLTDLIYTRDMWMHRLDICRATGSEMVQSADHDGRIVALVLRDLARKLMRKRSDTSIVYALSGPAGGAWRIGRNTIPSATICMPALDFNLLAAGRRTATEVRAQNDTAVNGDPTVVTWALDNTSVPY